MSALHRTCGLAVFFSIFSLGTAEAHHRLEITGAVGVSATTTLGLETEAEDGTLSGDPSPLFLAEVGYRTDWDGFAYLAYTRQEASYFFTPKGATAPSSSGVVARDDLVLGGYLEHTYGLWVPYLGAGLGVTRFSSGAATDEWRPTAVLDGGVKLDVSELLQLRLLARLPMTLLIDETKILCGTPDGCLASTNGTPIFQGQLLLGATLTF